MPGIALRLDWRAGDVAAEPGFDDSRVTAWCDARVDSRPGLATDLGHDLAGADAPELLGGKDWAATATRHRCAAVTALQRRRRNAGPNSGPKRESPA